MHQNFLIEFNSNWQSDIYFHYFFKNKWQLKLFYGQRGMICPTDFQKFQKLSVCVCVCERERERERERSCGLHLEDVSLRRFPTEIWRISSLILGQRYVYLSFKSRFEEMHCYLMIEFLLHTAPLSLVKSMKMVLLDNIRVFPRLCTPPPMP